MGAVDKGNGQRDHGRMSRNPVEDAVDELAESVVSFGQIRARSAATVTRMAIRARSVAAKASTRAVPQKMSIEVEILDGPAKTTIGHIRAMLDLGAEGFFIGLQASLSK